MRVGRAIALGLVAGAFSLACSSEPLGEADETTEPGVYGNFSPQVPADKPLDSLTDEESQQLCQELSEYFHAIWELQLELICRFNAVVLASVMNPVSNPEAQQACQDARTECLATPKPSTDNCPNTASCSLPVSHLVTCTNDGAVVAKERASSVPDCEELTLADLDPPSGGIAEECVDLALTCPDF
jgi:hypothetical protein